MAAPRSAASAGGIDALQENAARPPCARADTPERESVDCTDILIIVHQAHSTPGRVGERLERRGYRLDVRRPALGDPLPDTLSSYAGAVVFGGPMSANDDLPFVRAEIDFIAKALEAETPLLGICLGAQMMAKALGAQVSPHQEGACEIGYYPLAATDTGAALLNWPSHVYHWHSEGFELPPGAELLATGEVFPNQAFRYGESAYALQFHPEVTREMMCLWTVRGAHNLTKRGAQPGEAHLAGWSRYDAAVCRWLDGFLDMWLVAESGRAKPRG
ncbi:glutamine amidotransferase [Xanthobacter variabilis]|uniref:glutamine amidotransferase n=1 Tax=Xanthobacter variabilis TaxID=3119932 RepID=UPI00374F575C